MSGSSVTTTRSLFQAEDGGLIPTLPLQSYNIMIIKHETAKRWVEKWHYSHRIPTGKNICYGLFATGELYAVIVYGVGVNPYQASYLGVERVIEIKRMCRSEPKREYPMSKFIAITAKMVRKEYPYDCIVAFADPEQGHEGIVYKASGFRLHGTTNPEYHLIGDDGEVRHRRFAFRYARRNDITIAEARESLGMTRIRTMPKYRWVRFSRERGDTP